MILSRPARILLCSAVAACALSIPEARAALLVYEPFDYGTTVGEDRNSDGKKDLMGLAGGLGWSGAWTERTGTATAQPTVPLDYVNSFDLPHPSGDPRFSDSEGPGSLTIVGYTASDKPTQTRASLRREFAEPFLLSEGTTLWLSVLLRKDFEVPDSTGQTQPNDAFEIGFAKPDDGSVYGDGFYMGDIRNGADSTTTFGIRSEYSLDGSVSYLAGSGPSTGTINFLVMKLSVESGKSRLEFFLNPSLDTLSPLPDLILPLAEVTGEQFSGLNMNMNAIRPIWSVDEIRVGNTYADVVPEPSSLLLTGLGVTMLGGARLRRSRVSLS